MICFSVNMKIERQQSYMLHSNQVRANEGDVIDLLEHADDASVIDTRNHDRQKIRQQRGLFLQVERERLVVAAGAVSMPLFIESTHGLTSRRSRPGR